METFIWSMHTFATEYPEGFTLELGNAYQYAAEPRSPVDQRTFRLSFKTMKYFTNGAGQIDLTNSPIINLGLLDKFYRDHRMWKSFIYPHPVYGNVVCRFKRPLSIPQGIEGGQGAVQGFSVELIEQP